MVLSLVWFLILLFVLANSYKYCMGYVRKIFVQVNLACWAVYCLLLSLFVYQIENISFWLIYIISILNVFTMLRNVYYLSLNRRLCLVALAITLLLAWLGLIVILLAYISVYKL